MRDNVDDERTDGKRIPYRAPPWMKLYWRDVMEITLGLGRADDLGIYTLMMGLAWMRGDATLPSELGQLKQELKLRLPKQHGHTFNRSVPMLLERFFERLEDGRFIHRGVENELRRARALRPKPKQTESKREANEKQNVATSAKINGLQTHRYRDADNIDIREEGNINLEARLSKEVLRAKRVNGFKSLAQPLLNGSQSLNDVPRVSATSTTTRNGLSYEEAMALSSAPPASRFDRH